MKIVTYRVQFTLTPLILEMKYAKHLITHVNGCSHLILGLIKARITAHNMVTCNTKGVRLSDPARPSSPTLL